MNTHLSRIKQKLLFPKPRGSGRSLMCIGGPLDGEYLPHTGPSVTIPPHHPGKGEAIYKARLNIKIRPTDPDTYHYAFAGWVPQRSPPQLLPMPTRVDPKTQQGEPGENGRD